MEEGYIVVDSIAPISLNDVTNDLVRESGFESMEGAAVAQIGQRFGIPVSEIRAISNIASRRDMRPENIRLALTHLRDTLRAWRRTTESS